MAKFLIIRFSSIGDIVLTTPVIRCLKLQVPDAEVHFLTKAGFAAILQPNPYIDKLHLHEADLSATIKLLKKEGFDYIIDLHHNLRTLRLKRSLNVKSFSFDKLNLEKWLFTSFKINRLPQLHIVDRYLACLNHFGVKNDGLGLDYFIGKKDQLAAEFLPVEHQDGFVGLVIGAALATKQLPQSKLIALCSLINMPVVLLGGPEDSEMGEAIAANFKHVFNACGKCTLGQSAGLVSKAMLIITHDTGLMHIAAAFQKPILSIWGNTVPQFGMGPYYAAGKNVSSKMFEVGGLNCRPCSKIGYKKCPKGHFNCMQQQDLNAISLAVESALRP